jgi:drug/metabolite transporter (DMT)-like permease
MAEGVLYFSTMAMLVKLVSERIPTNEIVLARTGVTFVLSSVALYRLRIRPWEGPRGWLTLRGFAGFVALQCYVHSLATLPLGEATLIQYTSPVFTALFAALWLGEGAGRGAWLGTLLSLAGMVAVARPATLFGTGAAFAPTDVLVAFMGAVFAGFAYVVIRRMKSLADPMVIVWSVPAVGLPLTLVLLAGQWWLLGESPVVPRGGEWLQLLAIGVLTQAAQVRMTQALHLEAAGRAAAVTYLQVALSVAWGLLVFSEVPTLFTLLGAACIMGGTVVASGAVGRSSSSASGDGLAPATEQRSDHAR